MRTLLQVCAMGAEPATGRRTGQGSTSLLLHPHGAPHAPPSRTDRSLAAVQQLLVLRDADHGRYHRGLLPRPLQHDHAVHLRLHVRLLLLRAHTCSDGPGSIGHIILVASTTPASLEKPDTALGLLALAIVIMGIGGGCIKSNVAPLIGEQYTGKMRKKTLKSGEVVILSPAVTYQRIYNVRATPTRPTLPRTQHLSGSTPQSTGAARARFRRPSSHVTMVIGRRSSSPPVFCASSRSCSQLEESCTSSLRRVVPSYSR